MAQGDFRRAPRRAATAALVLGFAGLLTGCGGCDEDESVSDCLFSGDFESRSSRIVFFNQLTDSGSSDADDVIADLFAATESDALVEERPYNTTATPGSVGVDLDDETQDVAFTLRRSDGDLELVSNRLLELEDGEVHTVVAMGDVDEVVSVRLESFRRDDRTPATGQARIRFIHTLSRLDTAASLRLDVLRGTTLLVDALDYGNASGFVGLAITDGQLQVTLRDADDDTVASPSCSLSAGDSFDAILAYQSFGDTDLEDIRLFCHPL